MTEERASYDAEGTCDIETPVLLDLLGDACQYLREYGNHIEHGRCVDLRRRVPKHDDEMSIDEALARIVAYRPDLEIR